mgnify:CR=1 FL=1
MTSRQSNMSSEFTGIDLRDLAMTIARAHNLLLETVVAADEVAQTDDEFLTAICISADLDMLCK